MMEYVKEHKMWNLKPFLEWHRISTAHGVEPWIWKKIGTNHEESQISIPDSWTELNHFFLSDRPNEQWCLTMNENYIYTAAVVLIPTQVLSAEISSDCCSMLIFRRPTGIIRLMRKILEMRERRLSDTESYSNLSPDEYVSSISFVPAKSSR